MEYINPLFANSEIIKKQMPVQKLKPKQKHATRSDKCHNVKYPISTLDQMRLKSYCRQAQFIYRQRGLEDLKQTKFNTVLLRYGLNHKEILTWDFEYVDTKVYMHTNLLEKEYIHEIGGPHGLAVQKNMSDRKVVYHIIHSVLKWLEKGEGTIEKIL